MARSNILGRLRDTYPHHDPDIVFEEARREEVCPFEVQLELAQRADAIVADYNYVFEPGVALRHLTGEELRDAILARRRGAQPARPRAADLLAGAPRGGLRALANRLVLQPGEIFADLSASVEDVLALLERAAEELPEGDAIAETAPPAEALHALRAEWEPRLARATSPGSARRASRCRTIRSSTRTSRCSASRRSSRCYGPDFTCVVERRPDGHAPRARLPRSGARARSRLPAGRRLDPAVGDADAARSASARARARAATARRAISLPPPFPPENRKVMILPHVRTTFAAREKNYGRIARLVADMSDAHSGNDLVLFPSYRFLAEVAARHAEDARAPPRPAPGPLGLRAPADPRGAGRSAAAEGILLFAVSGGMYAEGVDYPGELSRASSSSRRRCRRSPSSGSSCAGTSTSARRRASTTPTCSRA